MSAPREIDRADVLGELLHRFEQDDPDNAIEWVLDTLTELDILRYRQPPVCGETEGATGIACQLSRFHGKDVDHEGTHDPATAKQYPEVSGAGVPFPPLKDAPPFKLGDWVRNRNTGAVLQVTGDLAAKLPTYYQLTDPPQPRVFQGDGPEPPTGVDNLEVLDLVGALNHRRYLRRGCIGWTFADDLKTDVSDMIGFNWPASVAGTFREVPS